MVRLHNINACMQYSQGVHCQAHTYRAWATLPKVGLPGLANVAETGTHRWGPWKVCNVDHLFKEQRALLHDGAVVAAQRLGNLCARQVR